MSYTPTPVNRYSQGSLVPTPGERPLGGSTASPSAQKAFPSSSSAPSLYRQSLAGNALARRQSAQTPGPSGEKPQDVATKVDSPYRAVSTGGPLPVYQSPTSAPAPSLKPNTPVKEVVRLTPSSANAVGRARASRRLRTSISTLFIFIVVTTSPPYRAFLGWLDKAQPTTFKAQQWLSFCFLLYHTYGFLKATWQLAIPGAAALPIEPPPSTIAKAKEAVKAVVPNQGSPASAAPPAQASPFVKSSPKTRASLPQLDSPRAFNRSPTHSDSPQSKANAPPPAKEAGSHSPNRSFLASRPETPDALRTSLLNSSGSAQSVTALNAFQARHSPQSGSNRRVSGNLQQLKAEAMLAAAG